MTLSTDRAVGLCIPLRAARPSTMPATSPMMTNTTISEMPARMRSLPSVDVHEHVRRQQNAGDGTEHTPTNANADATAP